MTIESVRARQVLDMKCRPIVEVEVVTSQGHIGRGAAPTGQSVGIHEAHVLRDGDEAHYHGRTVHRAVANVLDVIGPAIIGLDVDDQEAVDRAMIALDGTPDKSRLGGNAIYSTSIAVLRAAALDAGSPVYRRLAPHGLRTVPVPSFNIVNGGEFGGLTQSFNEFIVMPHGAGTIDDAVEVGVDVFERLAEVLKAHLGHAPRVASSYGYAAPSSDPRVVLTLMREAVAKCGYQDIVSFALDCASSEVYDAKSRTYLLNEQRVSALELIDHARALSEEFDLVFIEDLLDENDWEHFPVAVENVTRSLILGDDLIVTDRGRLERAVRSKAVDGFVLKPNQVGTITEALETHAYAVAHDLLAVPSGRSGGVIDDVVMDLSVGLQVPFQKNGAPRSGERIEKLNFLMRAADEVPGRRIADLSQVVRF